MHSTLLLSTLLAGSPLVAAWGDVGHRTVGYLAEKYLSPEASDMVTKLLANDKGYDISDAAVWADVIKHNRPYSAGWHYIDAQDTPPSACGVVYSRDCETSGCVVSAIVNQTSLILDPNTDDTTQKEALMYLIHFIGDIHQPLHAESVDRGGNDIPVCFDKRCTKENLHSIWDTDIVHKINHLKHTEKHNEEKTAAQAWADSLFSDSANLAAECSDVNNAEDCALQWASESNAYVCSYVLAKGKDWVEANDLGGAYYEGAVPVVTAQITNAGVRLGAWLNAVAAARSSQAGFVVQGGKPLENEEL